MFHFTNFPLPGITLFMLLFLGVIFYYLYYMISFVDCTFVTYLMFLCCLRNWLCGCFANTK